MFQLVLWESKMQNGIKPYILLIECFVCHGYVCISTSQWHIWSYRYLFDWFYHPPYNYLLRVLLQIYDNYPDRLIVAIHWVLEKLGQICHIIGYSGYYSAQAQIEPIRFFPYLTPIVSHMSLESIYSLYPGVYSSFLFLSGWMGSMDLDLLQIVSVHPSIYITALMYVAQYFFI